MKNDTVEAFPKKLLFIFRGMYSELMMIMPKLQDNEVQFTVQSDRTRLTNVITFVFMWHDPLCDKKCCDGATLEEHYYLIFCEGSPY
jgi:hypothetical protein